METKLITKTEIVPYAWSSFGYADELVIIEVDATNLRDVVIAKNKELSRIEHPPTVNSAYDCTGRAFGSNFRKLDFRNTEDGYVMIYIHSWAIDI